jgi:hypothetical protein
LSKTISDSDNIIGQIKLSFLIIVVVVKSGSGGINYITDAVIDLFGDVVENQRIASDVFEDGVHLSAFGEGIVGPLFVVGNASSLQLVGF